MDSVHSILIKETKHAEGTSSFFTIRHTLHALTQRQQGSFHFSLTDTQTPRQQGSVHFSACKENIIEERHIMQKFSVFDSAKYLFDEANSFVCFFLQYNIQNRCRNIVLRVYIYHSHILLLCYSMLVWLVVLSCLTSLVHSHIKNPQWYKKLQESQKRKKKKTFFTNTKSENVHWVI